MLEYSYRFQILCAIYCFAQEKSISDIASIIGVAQSSVSKMLAQKYLDKLPHHKAMRFLQALKIDNILFSCNKSTFIKKIKKDLKKTDRSKIKLSYDVFKYLEEE